MKGSQQDTALYIVQDVIHLLAEVHVKWDHIFEETFENTKTMYQYGMSAVNPNAKQ